MRVQALEQRCRITGVDRPEHLRASHFSGGVHRPVCALARAAPCASACEVAREQVVESVGCGCNARAIWQDLVDDSSLYLGLEWAHGRPPMGDGEALVRGRMQEVEALCRRLGVRRLELFGSAVREDFDPARSDLDFLVEIEPPTGLGYADAFFGLQEGLEKLFSRSVDLLSFGSVRNPHLRRAIERSKRSLYAA